ncbi:hypothetical protein SCHPADRAFT_880117 [Schizopora paradoxa]|uniref:Galactose oxidase n=1 Tax=Schizopora paradoxa TaxID=27342 RepID=A0A0H2RAD9_9AGAM|nr:hypothetical protein SCHPADRAFT_880117 [Schizopora paradoxa]
MRCRKPPFRAMHADLLWTLIFTPSCLCAFTNLPRWGQASALVNDKLLVHGGKTDQFNSYSYTSAPTNNDLLLLDLSSGFDPSSPPWQYVAGSEEPSTSQGPQLAWHSLSTFNESQLLLFGGDGGPNSPIVLPTQADSASLLDVSNITGPQWISELQFWADEPIRRIHHSTSSTNGMIYLVGGEKDDGSNIGLSDHYVFDPDTPSFTQLPTDNGPPDIYGHTSIVLADGRLLVFGGYCPSQAQLLPFSTIWSISTTSSSPSWSNLSVSSDSLPPSRRAFAAVWLPGDKILIHGGADAELQSSFSDGWILDTTQNPMTWSNVSALSGIGPRRDHFAVLSGSSVLLGFGYETNGPAPISMSIFDLNQNALVTSYSPPSSSTSTPTTLPAPSGTGGNGRPHSTGTNPNDPQSGVPSPDEPGKPSDTSSGKKKTAVALGAVFGILGLVVAGSAVYISYTRRSQSQRFQLLGDEFDSPTAVHTAATGFPWFNRGKGEKVQMSGNTGGTFLGLNIARRGQDVGQGRQRVDMLADEDERDFEDLRAMRERTGSSASWYSIRNLHERSHSAPDARPGLGSWFGGSVASLRSLGGLFGANGGIRRVSTREIEANQMGEKEWLPLDPFADEHALVEGDTLSVYDDAPNRLRGGNPDVRDSSSYSDPFNDSSRPGSSGAPNFAMNIQRSGDLMSHDLPSLAGSSLSSLTRSSGPLSLPPLAIVSSQNSSAAEHSTSSGAGSNKDIEGTRNSGTSHVLQTRPSSIIDPSSTVFQPVKRSDSWWSKFKRGPLREDLTKSPIRPELEFRDPNPAPKLSAIHEASLSTSESPESADKGRDALGLYLAAGMGKSLTSLKTSKTADSETIERLAGNVAVMQRETTEASGEYSSAGFRTPEASGSWSYTREPRRLLNSSDGTILDVDETPLVQSPVEGIHELSTISEITGSARSSPTKQPPEFDEWKTKSLRRLSQGGAVASRVASYERRITAESPTTPVSPTKSMETDGRRRRTQSVKYGLVHRPELFIANPDNHKPQSSGDSS